MDLFIIIFSSFLDRLRLQFSSLLLLFFLVEPYLLFSTDNRNHIREYRFVVVLSTFPFLHQPYFVFSPSFSLFLQTLQYAWWYPLQSGGIFGKGIGSILVSFSTGGTESCVAHFQREPTVSPTYWPNSRLWMESLFMIQSALSWQRRHWWKELPSHYLLNNTFYLSCFNFESLSTLNQ